MNSFQSIRLCFISAILLCNIGISHAQNSEADALIQSVSKSSKTTPVKGSPDTISKLQFSAQLEDPFQRVLYSEWQRHTALPYHIDNWVQKVLSKDYRGASHLWSRIEKDIPENFRLVGETTYAYLLWKLDLAQTFWNEWFQLLLLDSKRKSPVLNALNLSLEPILASWFINAAIQFTPEQNKFIKEKISAEQYSSVYDTLIAWSLVRNTASSIELARKILSRLPNNHPVKVPLAQSLSLTFAKQGDLANAGQVLKNFLEPAIEASGDKIKIAQYYLQIARLLYQAEALDAAEMYYRKIPNSIPEYINAHEELTWILLRKNDLSQLRGELKNFQLGLFSSKFLPEIHVVSAIANLKLCYYSKVQEDFNKFVTSQQSWVSRINAELAKEYPAAPPKSDFFSEFAVKNLAQREQEMKLLQNLSQESITAVIPAVGIQHHWQRAMQKQSIATDIAKKQIAKEYLRQWKNMEITMREAIRKMKFVKVELLSQISQLASKNPSLSNKNTKVALKINEDELAFPFDGVVWGDELFRLRSKAEGTCL